ncbi:unnamed protein product [Linum tenue]|uniref:Ribosomal eL28/Mak16 domain-containing protein n=1 Tax=Linum tenue TaxID=586396 RepID=A0AAV0QNR4_9ROSI|nr:unnamed protein product [Linum tenue]
MQHDEVIWQVIRHNHCSFMAKITAGNFCRNPYNVTGICNRSSCPLANSRYATIRDHDGVFYLYMKTIERAHKPNQLWERVKLPRNYEKALEIIDKHLMYWPKLLIHKIKQRLTKMTQMRIRMRKLALKTREKVVTLPRKEIKRDARRLEKAEKAAVLDKSIEKELVERLNKNVYGDIHNYPLKHFENLLDMEESQIDAPEEEEEEYDVEYLEGDYDELEEEDDIEDFGKLAMEFPEDHGDELDDEEMDAVGKNEKKRSGSAHGKLGKDEAKKKKPRVLVEILIRLPDPRFACRCKSVCKRWSSLISSLCFNRRFVYHHQSINQLPMPEDPNELQSTIWSFLQRIPLRHVRVPPMPPFRYVRDAPLRVLDCFRDLLLCGFWDIYGDNNELGRSYLVCNLFTKQWVALPLAPEKPVGYREDVGSQKISKSEEGQFVMGSCTYSETMDGSALSAATDAANQIFQPEV